MSRYKEERDAYQKKRIEYLNGNDNEIIRFFEKLLIFNDLIKALVKWKKEIFHQVEEKILEDLSFVPVMKCLYIDCLLSVDVKNTTNKSSLFDVFDFDAFSKGGVNKDCYYFMDKLPEYTIRIKENEGLEYLSKRDPSDNNNDNIDLLSSLIGIVLTSSDKVMIKNKMNQYRIMLDNSIEVLKGATSFPGFREREKLIGLTHMKIWEDAMNNDSSEMDTTYRKELLDEAVFLRWRIGA